MKKKVLGWAALLIFGGIWLLRTDYFRGSEGASNVHSSQVISAASPSFVKSEGESNSVDLPSWLKQESAKLAQVQEDPAKVEQSLRQQARQLTLPQLQLLRERSLDLDVAEDERFLALTLIAWSEQREARSLLEQISLVPVDPFLSPGRKGDFERVLRMQAVEGLQDLALSSTELQNSLRHIISRSGEAMTTDRAHRLLWSSQQRAPSPQEQDKAALKKLLQRPAGS
ncbi:MAG: hypothetical protein AAGB31_11735 [Bdellovibrio sp.]